jgi:hypothetical protein
MEGMNEGESIRKAAWRCAIGKTTSFRWRHRFLALPETVMARNECGIVEADETYFLRSFKGQRPLPRASRKRGGRAAKRGGPGNRFRSWWSGTVRGPWLIRSSAPTEAGEVPLALSARDLDIANRAVNLSKGIRVLVGIFHIQNANASHSRLKGWLQRFHGAAT